MTIFSLLLTNHNSYLPSQYFILIGQILRGLHYANYNQEMKYKNIHDSTF